LYYNCIYCSIITSASSIASLYYKWLQQCHQMALLRPPQHRSALAVCDSVRFVLVSACLVTWCCFTALILVASCSGHRVLVCDLKCPKERVCGDRVSVQQAHHTRRAIINYSFCSCTAQRFRFLQNCSPLLPLMYTLCPGPNELVIECNRVSL